MLKYVRYILIVVAVIVSLAYAPRTYAASADLMLVQIQAGGVAAATQELIVLYNNSPDPVDVTDYCLLNKNGHEITCLTTSASDEARYLPGWSFAVAASSSFVTFTGLPPQTFTSIFEPLSQSSGSIIGSSDSISLINKSGDVVDRHSWTTSISGGMLFARSSVPEYPPYFFDTDSAGDWSVQSPQFIPDDQTYLEIVELPDLCPNIEGEQFTLPDDSVIDEAGDCVAVAPVNELVAQLYLTELLPNAAGSDTGAEFIEVYNPNDHPVNLADYILFVGPQFEKQFTLPDRTIAAGSYYALSNSEARYSLLNTSSRAQLQVGQQVISETPAYQNPKDDAAWALFEGTWQYVAKSTPSAANTVGPAVAASPVKPPTSNFKPCASNQYRSPETNRCRLIAANTSNPKPCAANQERNPATNRCRLIARNTGPTPCKEGQERNPETNRCRMVKGVPDADYAVLGAETAQDDNGWYAWIAVGLAVVAALVYAAWEWRREVGRFFSRLRHMITRR
jgi:hypothetical protein